jgi:hypothetical protein
MTRSTAEAGPPTPLGSSMAVVACARRIPAAGSGSPVSWHPQGPFPGKNRPTCVVAARACCYWPRPAAVLRVEVRRMRIAPRTAPCSRCGGGNLGWHYVRLHDPPQTHQPPTNRTAAHSTAKIG